MSTSLKEEKARMLKLMGFSYKDNSHDLLSEQNIFNSLIKEQTTIDPAPEEEAGIPQQEKEGSNEAITHKTLKKERATNESIKESMYAAVPVFNHIKDSSLNRLWGTFPSLGNALIKREGLKNMYQYYDVAGQLYVQDTNLNAPKLYSIKGNVILKKGDTFQIIEKTKFLKEYNNNNLISWSKNGVIQQLRGLGKNQWGSAGINIISGTRDTRGLVSTYKTESGKELNTIIISKGKAFSDYPGGPEVIEMLKKSFNNFKEDQFTQATGRIKIDIPYMIYDTQGEDKSNENILSGLYISGKETTRKQELVKADEDIDIEPMEPKNWSSTEPFVVNKFDLSSQGQALIAQVVKEIAEYASTVDATVTINDLNIISSASNYYGGIVNPTHNNKGQKLGGVEDDLTQEPTTGEGNELANKKLAYNRAQAMRKGLQDALEAQNLTNLDLGPIGIQWRITDTGGVIDEKRKKIIDAEGNEVYKHPNRGQYAYISVGGKGNIITIDDVPATDIDVETTPLKTIRYWYAQSPGKLAAHPNAKFADITNFIATVFGTTRTKQTPVNQASKIEGQ
ncbi:hypothetical protein CL614_08650 [archaeon]|nr:hypothetical protein [archaeon]|tara:strand:- start:3318 stop:5012 length:1695 start_codon:yes stop_codon:yes gene_type:complete